MLYANQESDMDNLYILLKNDAVAMKYPNFLNYVSSYYGRRMEWALCYRKNLFVRGNNTNNICESAMMVMKEYILQRVKAFNMVHVCLALVIICIVNYICSYFAVS